MANKGRSKSSRRPEINRVQNKPFSRFKYIALGLLLGAALTGAIEAARLTFEKPKILTFEKIMAMKPSELEGLDIAEMNLLCVAGLKDSKDLDVKWNLQTLDIWAKYVKAQTEEYLYLYKRDPAKFHNMEGNYRMQMLITAVKQDLGVHYDSARENDEPTETFFANPNDLFVNGLLTPPNAGTCSSMPVLFVAIARRLGYPVKLVKAKNHLFARWESADGKERFNIEGTNAGMVSHPDEYYSQGIFAVSPEITRSEGYLQSLDAAGELAVFLDTRGICLRVNGDYEGAAAAFKKCQSLEPQSKIYAAKAADAAAIYETRQVSSNK